MVGETFGNYEVVAILGKGGMGIVYLAEHQRISRRVAIKVLAPGLTTNPDLVKRFFIEARATSLIHHPGIIEVFDCDIDATGRAYIVMEYLEGETLAACLQRVTALPWPTACAVGNRVACALGAAHERGIIHRDLKPENILLSSVLDSTSAPPGSTEIQVKVLDFGIAKLLSSDVLHESLTQKGMLLGTPTYISPEQLTAAGEVNHGTDVYSLGCILFEMICGRPPFQREGFRALLAAHMFQSPPLASTLAPAIPSWLDKLIARMLAKQPGDRPASMAEVAHALLSGDAGDAGRTLLLPSIETITTAKRISSVSWAVPIPSPIDRRPRILGRLGRLGRSTGRSARWRPIIVLGAIGGLAALAVIAGFALSRSAHTDDGALAPSEETGALGVAAPPPNLIRTISAVSAGDPPPAGNPVATPAAGAGRDPDIQNLNPSPIAPATSRPPAKRRSGEIPVRTRPESRRRPTPLETDGILDL